MAATGDTLDFSVASMIEDVLLEHGKELCAVNPSKDDAKAKAATKRYEATRWLRKTVGVVAAKDLPSEPSEEDFRMGLRSGIILCTVLNKIQPGTIPKIVAPFDSVIVPDGEPLSECPYFENITNFLEAAEERGIPTFEVDDLEEWGRLPKVVNCVLALSSYSIWKKSGGNGSFKYDGNPKPSSNRKQIVRKSLDMDKCDLWKDVKDKPLHMRVRDLLSDKKPEDIPVVVEVVLGKLIEEFERRLEAHKEKIRQNAIAKEKNEALARARNEEVKSSPRDRNKEMEFKMRAKLKKEEFLKPFTSLLNNDKEENGTSENKTNEETKSFSEIIKEMRRKAAANDVSNEMEKKPPTFTPKKAAAGDTNNEIEKKANIFTKKFPSDINNETPKIATTDTTSNINNEMEKKPTTEAKKSVADIFNQMEKKPTTEPNKPVSDVSKQMEKKPTTEPTKPVSDVSKQMEKKPTTEPTKPVSDVSKQMEKKPTTEPTKPVSDVSKQMEKKPTTEPTKPISDVSKQMEKKPTEEAKKPVNEVSNQMENKPTTEASKSISDINSKMMEKKETIEAKKSSDVNIQLENKAATSDININNVTEQKTTTDTYNLTSDINIEMEELEEISDVEAPDEDDDLDNEIEEDEEGEEDEEASDVDDSAVDAAKELLEQRKKEAEQRSEEAEQKRLEMELKRKEMEEKKEMEKQKEMEMMKEVEEMMKEMEGLKKDMDGMKEELEMKEEIEKKKEMERRKEMEERKKEMERKAAEDAKEEEYYNWVQSECGRLTVSAAKQQKLVDHQQKQLKALKNIFSTAKADLESMRTKHQEEFDNIGKHLRNLAQQASGYKKVVDENRKLYNLVQDLKGNIRVYCRSRPFLTTTNKKSAVDCIDETNVAVITYVKGKEIRKTYTFNRVFSLTATQAEVYKDTQPLIRSVLDGYNICIFAYGQTGSGKTHTMTGPENLTPENMGVNYRALNDLFEIQQQRKDMITYLVRVQMLEIYNEMVRDLLSPQGATKKLDIRLGAQDGINVPDAELIEVSKTEDVIHLMTLGHKNRAVGSTAMNDRSSRSHSCVTVHVSGKDLTSGSTVRGCMHLVDLAGSERADKTEATGDRLKEATHINKSLSALGDVIASLSQKNAHVPYRNSKLTLLLQDALGGQAKTLMFIHVSPDPDTVGETISTLKFAERVSTVELGAAKSNKDIIDLKDLKDQVAALKAALAKEGGDINISNPEESAADEEDEGDATNDSEPAKAAGGAAAKAKKATPAPAKTAQSAPAAKSSPAAAAKTAKPAAAAAAAKKAPPKKK